MKAERVLEMPRGPKRDDVTVNIEAAVYHKAKMVATHRRITLAEYLTDLLRKLVDRDYQKLVDELGEKSNEN